MVGTKAGGLKAAATNKARHGEDFYHRMGERIMRKTPPDAIKMANKTYFRIDVIEKLFKEYSKYAIKDFKHAREQHLNELWDSGADLDIRFEANYTENVIKNLKVFSQNFKKRLNMAVKEAEEKWEEIGEE